MKLKFRADAKDIFVFIIFALILFYLVAIGVLNITSFGDDGTFHGFNPLPAFSEKYLAPTMVFFLFVLIIILTSVSSYFFEREKGFGITTTPKQEKGYSRWASEKEFKSQLKLVHPKNKEINAAGVPLINNGKEIWVDDGEYHNLIIGSTGSGKTQIMVHPLVKLLAKNGESMIVTDPKGEIYEENANLLRERGYNIVLLNFREPSRGNAWNPLHLPYTLYKEGNQDKANELLDDLALNILYDESSQNQDPFWEKTSADYFTGLSLALFEDARPEEINLNSINLITTVGEDKYLGKTYIKEYFSEKDPISPAYINVASTINAPEDTKGSILSVFKQKIKLFSSRENISEMLSHNDFDIKDIGRKKTAVFIVVQDEKKTYHSLVTIFIKQCYETLIDVAQESGGKLPFRTNFILDEFANMPPLKDVTTMVTAARSRNIRFSFIIQNFAQLYQVYGKENGETIKGNCGNIIYLISSELSALEEISKMAGEVKSKEKDKTASTPLVTVSDLQRLKQWETIIIRTRMMPFKTKLTPNFKMDWGERLEKSGYPTREKNTVEVFDLKQYVENRRKKAIDNASNIMGNELGGLFQGPSKKPSTDLNMDDLIKRIDQKIAELEEEERREKELNSNRQSNVQINLPKATNEKPVIEEKPIIEKKPVVEEPPVIEDNAELMKRIAEIEKNISSTVIEDRPKVEDNTELMKRIENIEKNILSQDVEKTSKVEKPKTEKPKIEKNIDDIKTTKNANLITDDQFFDDFFGDD